MMKLKYRGTEYDSVALLLDVLEGDVAGKYRGQAWRPHYLKHIPVPQPNLELSYRGVTYSTQEPISTSAPLIARDTVTVAELLGAKTRLVRAAELDRVHHIHLQRNLEHRLEVARSQDNQHLVKLLEAERDQII
jgi:hypothetical protein